MTPRTKLALRALLISGLILGCTADPEGPSGDVQPDTFDAEAEALTPTCFTEDPGCGCLEGTEPVTCVDSHVRGGRTVCLEGAMYCVDGIWSDCQDVYEWTLPAGAALIATPGACDLCSPDCFVALDTPDQNDIDNPPTGVSSTDVVGTSGPPSGITLIDGNAGMTGTATIDTDMDGVPDVGDDCPMTPGLVAFFGCTSSTTGEGFFHVLAPGESATDPLDFLVEIREADIYVLVDTTGSMSGEIANLRSGLASMITNIRTTIPDTWFGVGGFDDYPYSGYGSSSRGDRVYYHLSDLGPSTASAQAAVNSLTTHYGSDYPESNTQALYAVATGNGITTNGTNYLNSRNASSFGACPAGRWGYPCFRPDVIPIVIMVTDAEMHNGPNSTNNNDYHIISGGSTSSPTYSGNFGQTDDAGNIGDVSGSWRIFEGSTSATCTTVGMTCAPDNTFPFRGTSTSRTDNSYDSLVRFRVDTRRSIRIDTHRSSFDTYLYLYNYNAGAPNGVGSLIEADDDDGRDRASRIIRTLDPGEYVARIDGHSNDQGNFRFYIGRSDRWGSSSTQALPTPSPANYLGHIGDVSSNMRRFNGTTARSCGGGTTTCNVNNDWDHGGGTSSGSRDAVVRFRVDTAQTVTIDLSGSSFDTTLFLYSGNGVNAANLLEYDDDGGSGADSRIVRFLPMGDYTLRIDGHSSDNGNWDLSIGVPVVTPAVRFGVEYSEVVNAMLAQGIRLIGVNSSGAGSAADRDLDALAADIDSLDASGNSFVEQISSNGSGLSTAIVDAVVDLANYSRIDVDVVAENLTLIPGVQAADLIDNISVASCARCSGAIPNGCSQCLPGTDLDFSVTFLNDVIPQTLMDQVFNFDLIVRADLGAFELQRVPVRIVVPGMGMLPPNYMPGSFSRIYDAEDTCPIPQTRPHWGQFRWEADTPGDSQIRFEFRAADDEADLSTTAAAVFTVPINGPSSPAASDYFDVGDYIIAAGGDDFRVHMEVTASLIPSTDGTQAPTLINFGIDYTCVDGE